MSQYPPDPNYNPYEQRPNDPNAAQGTSYGGTPSSGGQPYNPYPGNPPSGPGPNSGPYGPYSTPPPPSGAPNTDYNPYDPYSPTYVSGNSNPAYGGYQAPPPPAYPTQQGYQGAPPLPTPPPAPRRKGPSAMVIVLAVVALIVIIGGILIGFLTINGHNNSAAATATAQANATATAHANATATADAALTATAVASTFPFSNKQVMNDPLSGPLSGTNWNTGSGCDFASSAYHITESSTNTFNVCFNSGATYSNFTFQVEMSLVKGDGGGIVFRANETSDQFYRLTFYSDGTYGLYVYVNASGSSSRTIKTGNVPSGTTMSDTNTIAIVANGTTLSIYFNKQQLDTVSDSTYSSGEIALTASDITNPVEAVFTNAQLWQLP